MGTVIPAITFGISDPGLPYVRPVVGAFTFKGAWAISSNYLTYDTVTTAGGVYTALLPNVGVTPGTRTDIWGLMIPSSGGVSNVALTTPSWLTVTGSPVTSTGTLAITATNGATGTGAVVLATSPTLTTPVIGNVVGPASAAVNIRGGAGTTFAMSVQNSAATSNLFTVDNAGNITTIGGFVVSSTGALTTPLYRGVSGQPVTVIGGSGATFDFIVNNIADTKNLFLVNESSGVQIGGATSGTTSLVPAAVASGVLTLPAATDTLVGRATTDTLTNKTLTSAVLTTPAIGSAGGTFAGSTSGTTTLKAAATASGTLTLPAATGTLALGIPTFQKFTSSGTFTIPAGVTGVKVTVVAGGGAGGGANSTNNGGGGGSGSSATKFLTGLTPGNTLAVTVGAGGTGVSAAAGNNGGASSVASGTQTITTISTSGGGGGGFFTGLTSGGAGGAAGSGGDFNYGGSAGQITTSSIVLGAIGGPSVYGGAGVNGINTVGGAGQAPGAGGGGAGSSSASFAGGAGAAGNVIFEWVQ